MPKKIKIKKRARTMMWGIHHQERPPTLSGETYTGKGEIGVHLMPVGRIKGNSAMKAGPGYQGTHFLRDAVRDGYTDFQPAFQAQLAEFIRSLPRPNKANIIAGRGRWGGGQITGSRMALGSTIRSLSKRANYMIGALRWINPRLAITRAQYGRFGGGLHGEQRIYLNWSVQQAGLDFALWEQQLKLFILEGMTALGQYIKEKAVDYAHEREKGTPTWGTKTDTTTIEQAVKVIGPVQAGGRVFLHIYLNSIKWRSMEYGLSGHRVSV